MSPQRSGGQQGRTTPSRRTVLRLGGVAAGLGLVGVDLGRARPASAAAATDTLVVINLAGGMDGLSVVAPVGDGDYARARPTLALPTGSVKKVDDLFGLHPALAPLFSLWDAGKLAAVHAVGLPDATRSHYQAAAALDRAAPASVTTGWIDRVVGLIPGAGNFTASAVGDPVLPGSLAGPGPGYAMSTLDSVKVEVSDSIVPLTGWQQALGLLHAGAPAQVSAPVQAAITAVQGVQGVPPAVSAADAGYPATNLGLALHDVGRLIKANVGLRIATVEHDGWDMHDAMGRPGQGRLVDQLSELANALLAFARNLGPDLDRVTVVTVSEFGRRVAENGSGGTDHGHGNAVLLLGGAVNGGRVYGHWPTLAPAALADGDLAMTTDYRAILAELLSRRCGISATTTVFPGFTGAALNLVDPRPPS